VSSGAHHAHDRSAPAHRPFIMVPVYRGGDEFEPCLRSIRESIGCFERVFISCNGPSAIEDEQRARDALGSLGERIVYLRTTQTYPFIPHFAFYVEQMHRRSVRPSDWVLMLQHDDWLNPVNVQQVSGDGSNWELEPGTLYLGPWDVYWEPTVEAVGGIAAATPERVSALYDLDIPAMDVGKWIARELTDPYYINTTGAIAQFRHWAEMARARPRKPGGMRFEMTLATSRGIDEVRQFPVPLVSVMARPDSEREQYSTWAKRKDDAHFVAWAARNWITAPRKAVPTMRAIPGIASRSMHHLLTRRTRVN